MNRERSQTDMTAAPAGQRSISRRQLGRLASLAAASAALAPFASVAVVGAQAPSFANGAFERAWLRNDFLVLDGRAGRSWTWGPNSHYSGREPYRQGPAGQRQVQYFDKARMEINDPANPDRVTFGLLVREMVSGRIALGDEQAEVQIVGPAGEAVAGDPVGINALAPTYASFINVASLNADRPASPALGQRVTQTIDRNGQLGTLPADAANLGNLATITGFEPNLQHNIPDRFLDFLLQFGPIYVDGRVRENQPIFQPWQLVMGFPITEPYWTRAIVAGRQQWVLVQLYERRALTYTPTNSAGFQVEMGNVGLHYFRWRYPSGPPDGPPVASGLERVITIDQPSEGAGISTGARIRGRVTVAPFENTLSFRVYDNQGQRIGSGPLPVTAELGQPGLYNGPLRFAADRRGAGYVEIADISPANGFVLARATLNVNLGSGSAIPLPFGLVTRVITIDSPADGARFVSGNRISGRVTVGPFENSLTYRVYDSNNNLIGSAGLPVRTDDAGGPGTFEGPVVFPTSAREIGRIEVVELGAADGAVLASAMINVILNGDSPSPRPGLPRRVITIESPADGAAVDSGFRIRGRVTVAPFENNLAYRVYDTGGNLLTTGSLSVTPVLGEFGTPGRYEGLVFYPAGRRGAGWVEVLDLSAENGSVLAAAAINVGLGGSGPVPAPPATPRRVITIDEPANGATVSSGVTARGRVTVAPFENTLTYRLYDTGGVLLGAGPLSVTPVDGVLGNPGTYAGPIAARAGFTGQARLVVLEVNAAEGSLFAHRAINLTFR